QEEEINEDCINFSDICCAAKGEEPKTKSYLWLWILILLILILLVVLGYLYRETLKAYWITYRGNKKSPPSRGSPFLPPSSPSSFQRGIHPRRIVPVSNNPSSRTMPVRKSSGEMEEVLKKLKDMGK
ncbi:MAG: hypothetical protein PHV68_09880, partial [Candidatus Gastranaerophilales bacterium]|nr:hypothetical protein [Candidatus Gastranaerophilales bacterium]